MMRTDPMQAALARTAFGVQILGVAITAGFMLYSSDPTDLVRWMIAPVFLAWAAAPYWALAVRTRRARSNATIGLIIVTSVVVGIAGALAYHNALVVDPGPTDTTAFIFIPMWQTLGLALVWPLARYLDGPEPDEDDDEMDLEA